MTRRRGDLAVAARGGRARFAGRRFACTIGAGGVGIKRIEGDGVTPVGVWRIEAVYFRPDRIKPQPGWRPIRPWMGWSDDPNDPLYNRLVRLPRSFGHERLWRGSPEYDLIAVLNYNRPAIEPGAGSAVFLHIYRSLGAPTAGCVGFRQQDLYWILQRWRDGDRVRIG